MTLDERRAGEWILGNAQFVWPAAAALAALYVFTSNAWLSFAAFAALGALYAKKGYDARVLFGYCALMLAATGIALPDIYLSNAFANLAYMFLMSGTIALLAGLIGAGAQSTPAGHIRARAQPAPSTAYRAPSGGRIPSKALKAAKANPM